MSSFNRGSIILLTTEKNQIKKLYPHWRIQKKIKDQWVSLQLAVAQRKKSHLTDYYYYFFYYEIHVFVGSGRYDYIYALLKTPRCGLLSPSTRSQLTETETEWMLWARSRRRRRRSCWLILLRLMHFDESVCMYVWDSAHTTMLVSFFFTCDGYYLERVRKISWDMVQKKTNQRFCLYIEHRIRRVLYGKYRWMHKNVKIFYGLNLCICIIVKLMKDLEVIKIQNIHCMYIINY